MSRQCQIEMGITKNAKMALAGSFAFAIATVVVVVVSLLGFSVSNTTAQVSNITSSSTANDTATIASMSDKPVDGYDAPQGHINAVRHIFNDPALRVEHFCKPSDKIVLVCQLYDGASANATLIGVEYIITQERYDSLPDREKPYWHAHRVELRPDRADPMMPELSPEEARAQMAKLMPTWGKVVITWNPDDELPSFPPQVQLVDHPFMINATVPSATSSNSTGQ
ncbi:MAG TPA: DUF1264 domain-containing protein [Nitrososphaera sp.]|jgi:hypothetical protein